MRGNRLARGGDPMKTRSQKRREKKEKLDKTKRVQRLKKRLGRLTAKKFAAQQDSHTTALMESYILRRKAERAAEKEKQEAEATAKRLAEEREGGDTDAQGRNDAFFDMYEESVFADDNPRAQHKRMKEFMKGTRPAPQKTELDRARRPHGSNAGGQGAGQRRSINGAPAEAPRSAAKGHRGRQDQRNKRVETRSLY